MGIAFYCQNCGARFDVDERLAGKRGRCKACGQGVSIPNPQQIVSLATVAAVPLAAAPALRAEVKRQAAARSGTRAAASADWFIPWLKMAARRLGFAPSWLGRLSIDAVRPNSRQATENSEAPTLVKAEGRESPWKGAGQSGGVQPAGRGRAGAAANALAWFRDSAYSVSVPFLVIFLVSTALKNQPTAVFGASAVVLLNLGRLLAIVAERAVDLARHGRSGTSGALQLRRVAEPAVTILLVLLAFAWIPWLSSHRLAPLPSLGSPRSGNGRLADESTSVRPDAPDSGAQRASSRER
jgi:hypothetical protein